MAKIRLPFASLAADRNIKAFIRVLREGESWNDDENPGSEHDELAFRVRYGGWANGKYLPAKYFTSFDDHPRVYESRPDGRVSSAAGAGQITATTWDDFRARYEGIGPRFTPTDQTYCIIAIIHAEGALDDVIDGRLDEAMEKCRNRWSSLPGSTDSGGKLTVARAHTVWRRWGGGVPTIVATAPGDRPDPVPIEDRSRQARPEDIARINQPEEAPVAAPLLFIVPLLQSLFEAFSPVIGAKAQKALERQGVDAASSAQVAEKLLGIVQNVAAQATGMPVSAAADPVVAVATVKSDPALLAKAQADVSDYVDQITPLLTQLNKYEQAGWAASEDSMDRAAARSQTAQNEDWMAKALVGGILLVSAGLITLVSGVAIAQIVLLPSRTPTTEVWAALTGIIGTTLGILGTVYAFRFGTTRQSAAKDVTNAALADMASRRRV